ncbi:MAG: flippase [Bacteroidales bacterium]|jgi:O-antigen/teichoic acid export membrane protein|nr:flippase [Bacteroidales bacterium]
MNKILKNLFWLFFDKIIRILGSLLVGIWIARYLGPSDFGILNYALAYTALFMLFVNLGLDQIVVRELVKFPEKTHELMGTAFTLKLTGAITGIMAVYFSLCLTEIDILTKTIIFIVSLTFIAQSLNVVDYFFQSKILSKNVVIARNSAFLISTLLKIFFIINKYSVIYFAMANCLDCFMASLFLIMIYTKAGNQISLWRFNKKIAKKLILYCWPLAISVFLITIHMKIDQVMIGNMLNTEQVGVYSVAVRLSEAWYFIPGILVSTLMPYFIELRETDKNLFKFRLMQLYALMFWMGIGVGIFIIFFGEDIIKIFFGYNYSSAYKAMVINIWGGIFVAQSYAKGIWVINENLQFHRITANIIAVTINIVGNYYVIPLYGITGAAIVTLVTRFVNNWITPILIKPYRKNTILSIKSINLLYVYKKKKELYPN